MSNSDYIKVGAVFVSHMLSDEPMFRQICDIKDNTIYYYFYCGENYHDITNRDCMESHYDSFIEMLNFYNYAPYFHVNVNDVYKNNDELIVITEVSKNSVTYRKFYEDDLHALIGEHTVTTTKLSTIIKEYKKYGVFVPHRIFKIGDKFSRKGYCCSNLTVTDYITIIGIDDLYCWVKYDNGEYASLEMEYIDTYFSLVNTDD